MTVVSFTIIDKSGRKALLVLSGLLMANCYMGLGGFFLLKTYYLELASKLNWLPLVCIAVYISAFSIGYGPVPWILMGEIYSSEVSNARCRNFSKSNSHNILRIRLYKRRIIIIIIIILNCCAIRTAARRWISAYVYRRTTKLYIYFIFRMCVTTRDMIAYIYIYINTRIKTIFNMLPNMQWSLYHLIGSIVYDTSII